MLQNQDTRAVVKRQHLLALSLLALSWAPAAYARGELFRSSPQGDWRLVHPEFGVGGGGLNVGPAAGGVWQTDLTIGAEHLQDHSMLGGLLKMDLSFFDDADPVVGTKVYRYDMTLFGTVSTPSDQGKLFARAGVGPMVTWSWANGRDAEAGLGAQAEVAAGWKSIAELYVDTRLSEDAYGPSFGISAGARLHVLLVLAVLGAAAS